jgi:hypothetical protein
MPDWRLEGPAIGEDPQGLLWRFSVPETQEVSTQIPRCSFRFPESSPIVTFRIPPRYSPPNALSKLLPYLLTLWSKVLLEKLTGSAASQ